MMADYLHDNLTIQPPPGDAIIGGIMLKLISVPLLSELFTLPFSSLLLAATHLTPPATGHLSWAVTFVWRPVTRNTKILIKTEAIELCTENFYS